MRYLLHHSLERSARNYPDKTAFKCGASSYSYQQLDALTNKLASWLQQQGVQKGHRVGVYMGRCLESAAAVYAILKAGAAFVPLDPSAPANRTRFLLEDCNIQQVVSAKPYKRGLAAVLEEATPLAAIAGVELENAPQACISWEAINALPEAETPAVPMLGDDLAYIMYTSGTTGTPKGIMHTHNSGLAYAKLSAELFGLTHADVIGNHASLFFDISTLGYLTAPLIGATTILVTEAHTIMPASLAGLLANERLTVWYSVPLALIQMLESQQLPQLDVSALRWVLFGGEPFPPKPLCTLMQLMPNATFSNIYGPAEVNQCTYYNLPQPPSSDAPIPLGYVWGNTEALIVDAVDQPVKQGEKGDLLIRSATMMAGYWNQPERTEKSLFTCVGADGLRKVFYRTGDVASLNADGLLEYHGRKDRQVKVRGYRVELEEVISAMLAHPQVQEASAFVLEAENSEKSIAAAVVVTDGQSLTPQELAAFAREQLPRYAVPAQWLILDKLPRTNAGKTDVRALKNILESPQTQSTDGA